MSTDGHAAFELVIFDCDGALVDSERLTVEVSTTEIVDAFRRELTAVDGVERLIETLHATGEMGVAPGRAAVIEDSVSGVEAAVAAGMTCFGFAGSLSRVDRLVAAGAVPFEHMSELSARIVPAHT